jgi:hypothetical protein
MERQSEFGKTDEGILELPDEMLFVDELPAAKKKKVRSKKFDNLKYLEKRRRRALIRHVAAMNEMVKAYRTAQHYKKAIEEIKREKNPQGIWAQLAAIEAGIEQLGRAAMKNRAA